jgi:lysophospholipase L1-like esterase
MFVKAPKYNFLKITTISFLISIIILYAPMSKMIRNENLHVNSEGFGNPERIYNAGMFLQNSEENYLEPSQALGKYVPITGNTNQLKDFFKVLKNASNQKVRIAHFGDSMVLGDVITEYLRANFQNRYGGGGVGFLPVVSDDYRMRRTSIESFSNDWSYGSIVSGNKDQFPLGINGAVSLPKPNSWVQYETTSSFSSTSSFDIARIFYSNADQNSMLEYNIDKYDSKTVSLQEGSGIKQLEIPAKGRRTKLKLKFNSGKAPYVYGVSLETNGNGVLIDNFPMRGNSGASLLDINENILQQFNKYLSYDLIILQYGANVYFPNSAGYIVYENKMVEVINRFKKIFPNAGILLISVGDKTIKRGAKFITNPDVTSLLETQKKIIARTGIAFWNMWEAMGGLNSMNQWVNAAPPYALKDYAHFTTEGGARIAEILFKALEDASKN